ncbi:MAG TPA: geranylgeranylglyceryl/heptaprenylglyceryl phosphate synthase [Bacteroidia bacterium]|nr:geranylgeranylglyceryl/heptaprenylglyceryl phosphate synthase [Bacteroidia bacterium]
MNVYSQIETKRKAGKKQFAILVDPDKTDDAKVSELSKMAADCGVDYIFVGGSLLINGNLSNCIHKLKSNSKIPVVLFPGNTMQIDKNADAILLLSLISGRNADLLIGKHVIAAPILRENNLETIATGYMLVESGNFTTVQYMSNTRPIPADKNEIAVCTAMAGEMLGLKTIYMDAGSGALNPVSEKMIESVRKNISLPIIIGGGINTPERAAATCKAGADVVVVGNSIEKDYSLIKIISEAVHQI